MSEEQTAAEVDARMHRVEKNGDALRSAVAIIVDLTTFTVGPGEAIEYEHVDLDRRYVEMALFYYWWITNLIFDATDYQWKQDFADAIALSLAALFPGVQAVFAARWAEYEGPDPAASMAKKAASAAHQVLHHIDPEMPVPTQFAHDLASEGTRVATEWFRKLTTWI